MDLRTVRYCFKGDSSQAFEVVEVSVDLVECPRLVGLSSFWYRSAKSSWSRRAPFEAISHFSLPNLSIMSGPLR